MDKFTSLYPVTTEGAAFYDYSTDYVVTCASNEGIYPPPPSYEQALTSSSVPWLLSEMTEVQNSILPQEDCEPHIELATLDFDVNLLQVANSQNMAFNNTGANSIDNISNLNLPQSEVPYVPPTPPLRRSPRLARKKKQAENILQLPPDLLFLEETTPISSTCLPLDNVQMQNPCKNSPNSSSYLELGSNNSQYLSGNHATNISAMPTTSTYSSPTHLPTSPDNTIPHQIYQQNSGYNEPFAVYSSPSHYRTPTGTSPQQTNQQNSAYNIPFAANSSPSHLTSLSTSKSPQNSNQQDSEYNAALAYSSQRRYSLSCKSPPQRNLQDSPTRYASLTNLTVASTSVSPLQTNLQESSYNDTFPRYTSLTNLSTPSTSKYPHQSNHQSRGYNTPLPTYPSPTHLTTSSLSISPIQEYNQSSGSSTTIQPEQCSPLPNFSTIKPPPSYHTPILPPPSYPVITRASTSYSTVEMNVPQRKSAGEISQILSSPEMLDDSLNAYLPSSSVVASSSTSSFMHQNIAKTSTQSQSPNICKKSDEETVSKRTRTKRLPRSAYESMSESERAQHNRNLSQQRCVRYRVNKKLTIKEMEKELDILEDKKKQLKGRFEALKLTKQKVEQLMPAFLRNS